MGRQPSDENLLSDAVNKHVEVTKKVPWGLAVDRGFYSSKHEKELKLLGIKRVRMSKRGRNPPNGLYSKKVLGSRDFKVSDG